MRAEEAVRKVQEGFDKFFLLQSAINNLDSLIWDKELNKKSRTDVDEHVRPLPGNVYEFRELVRAITRNCEYNELSIYNKKAEDDPWSGIQDFLRTTKQFRQKLTEFQDDPTWIEFHQQLSEIADLWNKTLALFAEFPKVTNRLSFPVYSGLKQC